MVHLPSMVSLRFFPVELNLARWEASGAMISYLDSPALELTLGFGRP